MSRIIYLFIIISLLLSACAPALPPAPVIIVEPVTATPQPSSTPTATATVAPAVTPTLLPAPKVVSHQPATARLTERHPSLQIAFNHAMDAVSVASALSISPTQPLSLTWSKDDNVSIGFPVPLTPGETITLTLAATATDQHGVALEQASTWHYSLTPFSAALKNRSRGKADEALQVSFNYPLEAASLRRAWKVTPAVTGTLELNAAGTTAVFTPSLPLAPDAVYTLTLGTLLSNDGAPLPPLTPITFTTPPPIIDIWPNHDRTLTASSIGINFDRPMEHASVEAAFTISPTVRGDFGWENNRLTFTPHGGYLSELTDYAITLQPTVADAQGERVLNHPYHWSFRTDSARDTANFGYGDNLQVVDADGPRALQFRVDGPTSLVTFDLYSLSREQFVNRYATGAHSRREWEEYPLMSTADLINVASWQMDVTSATQRLSDYNALPQQTTLPAGLAPGAYLLNLSAGHPSDQLFVVVTRYALVLKQSANELLVWASDINRQPTPNMDLTAFHTSGATLGQCRTNAEGVCRITLGEAQPFVVIGEIDGDLTVSWAGRAAVTQAPNYAANVYTDRPIYRPGQTVYFKAIVRADDDAALSALPEGTTVTARLRDARNNLVRTVYLTADEFGTVSSLFRVAEGALVGTYAIEIVVNGESHRQVFKVQDYVKPDYSVTLSTDASRYIAGDAIQATVIASYFFGEPVPNAHITIKQYELSRDYYCWEGCGEMWVEEYDTERTGQTDANGTFTFTLKAQTGYYTGYYDWQDNTRRSRWGIEVTVDDGSHQTVSSFAAVEVFGTDTTLNLNTGGYFKSPGQAFNVTASAQSVFDEPLAGHNLLLEVRGWNSTSYDYTTIIQSHHLTTAADGSIVWPLNLEEAGYYQISLTGLDRRGAKISTQRWVYVFDRSGVWTTDSNRAGFTITPDHASYAPGETATLLVETAVSGQALLTIERGAVRREQLVQLTAPLTQLPLTLLPDDAPNIYIGLALWAPSVRAYDEPFQPNDYYQYYTSVSDSRLLVASAKLTITPQNKQLTLSLQPDKAVYAPRETATFTVSVTDALGQPVAAQVSLALVDEAIFALSADLSKPLYGSFYAERKLGVTTLHSFQPWRVTGGYYCFYDCCDCGGGGGGDEGPYASSPRNNFQDTAYWEPNLRTDANGQAIVTITLPDNLTSWRLTAKAITVDTQAGEATLNITTHQEVIVRPLLPRTLTLSDTVMLSAIVANYGDTARTFTVEIETHGLSLTGAPTQTLTLAPQEQGVVGWAASATQLGEATVTISAQADGVGDAVKLSIPVQAFAIPNVTTKVGEFTDSFGTVLNWPADALSNNTVKIELSRSIAGSLLTGLEYLTGYPYGCVEQTMSRALPNAVVGRAFEQLGAGTLPTDLPKMINASVQRLYGFQHADGGWGWWVDDATDDYQTAWVVFGLATTKQAGHEVDEAVIKRGADYLLSRLKSMDTRTQAFALYSLAFAGYGDLNATEKLARRAATLDVFSQAGLALALHQLGAGDRALAMLETLAKTAKIEDGLVHWTTGEADGHYHDKTMSSDTRSTALALSAFVAIAPDHPLESGIVRWLMSQRQAEGWGSTNETSFAILALTDHVLAKELSESDTEYTVQLNGAVVAEGALGKGQVGTSIEIAAGQMHAGRNSLRLTQSGGGQLYYVISQRTFVQQPTITAAGVVHVTRAYLNWRGKPITNTIAAGDLVQVLITVTLPRNGFYMLVEDQLPGGLEALNTALNTTSQMAYGNTDYDTYYGEEQYRWKQLGYNNKEIRAGRVSFFITELSAGRHTFSYLARATRAGTFAALPTEVSAMYDLTLWGRSASARVVIAE